MVKLRARQLKFRISHLRSNFKCVARYMTKGLYCWSVTFLRGMIVKFSEYKYRLS